MVGTIGVHMQFPAIRFGYCTLREFLLRLQQIYWRQTHALRFLSLIPSAVANFASAGKYLCSTVCSSLV